MKEIVEQRGVPVILNAPVESIQRKEGKVVSVQAGGKTYRATNFISSIPIRELIEKLNPTAPRPLLAAAKKFHYRDFLTVALMVRGRDLFPDNWIYVHDPAVRAGRV